MVIEGTAFGEAHWAILAKSDADRAGALGEMTGMPVLLFDARNASLQEPGGQSLRLNELAGPPTARCILAAASQTGSGELDALRSWWESIDPRSAPYILRYDAGDSDEAVAVALLRSRVAAAEAAERAASESIAGLHRELGALRRELELSREQVTGLLRAAPAQAQRAVVRCDPSTVAFVGGDPPSPEVFAFPFTAWGLSRIDLYFQAGSNTAGAISLTVTGTDFDESIGRWSVPYGEISSGWFSFCFPCAAVSHASFLELRLTREPSPSGAPVTVLSDEYVEPLGASAVDQPPTPVRLPALCLWKGTPGQAQSCLFWVGKR